MNFLKKKRDLFDISRCVIIQRNNLNYLKNALSEIEGKLVSEREEKLKLENQINLGKSEKVDLERLKNTYNILNSSYNILLKEKEFLLRCNKRVETLMSAFSEKRYSDAQLAQLSNALNNVIKGREPETFYIKLFQQMLLA